VKLRQLVGRLPKNSESADVRNLVAALAEIFRKAKDFTPTEDTFTPVLTFSTPGDLAVTYNVQQGSYTKVGRVVMVDFNINTSAFTHTTAAGDCRITGLPYTASSDAGLISFGSVQWGGITKAGYSHIMPRVVLGTNYIDFGASGSGVAATTVAFGDMPTGGTVNLRGSIVYRV
jgi:hypothetical protein